jgi:hypothetical protein
MTLAVGCAGIITDQESALAASLRKIRVVSEDPCRTET